MNKETLQLVVGVNSTTLAAWLPCWPGLAWPAGSVPFSAQWTASLALNVLSDLKGDQVMLSTQQSLVGSTAAQCDMCFGTVIAVKNNQAVYATGWEVHKGWDVQLNR